MTARTRRRSTTAALVAAAVLLGLWWTAVPRATALAQGVRVAAEGTDVATIASLGERGAYALHYEDHGYVTLRVPVRNEGPLPLTLRGAALSDEVLPLLADVLAATPDGSLPARVGPGEELELSLTVRMDNCEYYTERAMGVFDGLALDVDVLGRRTTERLTFAHDLVVRSPMMVTCPSRVRDRDANQRRHAGR